MWRPAVIAAATIVWACGGASTPVPVAGTASDLAALAGDWSGEYSSEESGRSGSIVFRLVGGTDSATGDVVMIPSWGGGPGAGGVSRTGAPTPGANPPAPQVLAISFVRIEGGRVSGRLAPYTDPVCGCALVTVFEGQLKGDVLEGTYRSHHSAENRIVSGRWQVKRQHR
jgi:hypothetical protein